MSQFWIFVNFLKYGRVLNIHWDAIWEEFWIFQDSEYIRFLHMQVLHKALNMAELCSMAKFSVCLVNRVFLRFCICQSSEYGKVMNMQVFTGCWICLNKPEHALIISQYMWICLSNAEYDWLFRHIPEK